MFQYKFVPFHEYNKIPQETPAFPLIFHFYPAAVRFWIGSN